MPPLPGLEFVLSLFVQLQVLFVLQNVLDPPFEFLSPLPSLLSSELPQRKLVHKILSSVFKSFELFSIKLDSVYSKLEDFKDLSLVHDDLLVSSLAVRVLSIRNGPTRKANRPLEMRANQELSVNPLLTVPACSVVVQNKLRL